MLLVPPGVLPHELRKAGRAASPLFDDLADHERAHDEADRCRRRIASLVGAHRLPDPLAVAPAR
jgi:hypothetical protein